jgi:hypothetical protein
MAEPTPDSAAVLQGEIVPAATEATGQAVAAALTDDARAALAAAQELAGKAAAPATLRAYKADWTHYAAWCARMGFVPVPAEPRTVGAYLGSLAATHAPTTVRRRLSAIGKMHRFNDLAWNPAHRDIQGPLQGLLRTHGRPVRKAAALSLAMLRQLVATCDHSPSGRRDWALLLFGFAGALRRSELVALQVDDVAPVAGGLRLRIRRAKTDQAGQGAEIGLPRGKFAETCPVLAFEAWQAVGKRKAGPLFRRISAAGNIGEAALHPSCASTTCPAAPVPARRRVCWPRPRAAAAHAGLPSRPFPAAPAAGSRAIRRLARGISNPSRSAPVAARRYRARRSAATGPPRRWSGRAVSGIALHAHVLVSCRILLSCPRQCGPGDAVRMGNLIHDRKQKPLPWESHKTICRRCKGSRTVYYASMRGGVEVIGGRRVPCPDCGGIGTVREPDQPPPL